MILLRPKFKKKLFPAPDRPLENVATQNIFLQDLRQFFLVTGNRDRKFRYCSRIYVRNWFTLLNEKNPLLDFEGTRFANECTDPSKCSNDHALRSDRVLSDFTLKIVRQMSDQILPGRSESPLSDS